MKHISKSLLAALVIVFQSFAGQAQKKQPPVVKAATQSLASNEKWRGLFKLRPGVEVPFNFEFTGDTGKQKIVFLNGDERIDGGPVIKQGDSLYVKLDQFDNEFAFKVYPDSLSGVLRKQDGSGNPMKLVAEPGKAYRFKPGGATPAGNFSGKYDVIFKGQEGKEEHAVGVFNQVGSKLTGTFLRVTGDSRYLEGVVEGNKFYLSGFIGSSPSYFAGTFSKDGELNGNVISLRGEQPFSGKHNENAALPDANKLTFLKDGYKTLDFSFPDINGKQISLKDEKYKNKVVILTITGTWCPNCMDEATFISPWYKANRHRGVEVIAIHYERQSEPAFVKKVMERFRERFDIQYDQVFAGTTDKNEVANSLPALKNFISFPTMIIIDRKGEVAQIHTGFSGPATGKYYTEFVEGFNKELDKLLKE